MKQIVLYLITYACVTTTVAGVVQIEIHKKPGGGNTSPSSTLRPTTSTPGDGDDDFVETPVMKFISRAMEAKAVDLDANVKIQKENETFLIHIDGEVNYEDLNNISVSANLDVDSSFVKTSAEIAYFTPYAYVSNDFIHAKVETNDFIAGVKELLPILAPDMNINFEDSPFSNISTDEILANLQNMDFKDTGDNLLKGTLSIPNIADVDLYLDQNCSLVKAEIPQLTLEGMNISLIADTEFLNESTIASPEKNHAFDDYTDLIKVVKNAYDLAKQKQFSLSLDAEVKKDDWSTSVKANTIFDLSNNSYYADANIQYNDKKLDLSMLYNQSAIYFSLNDLLKGRLSNDNLTRIKDIVKEKLPESEEGTSFIQEQLNKILEKEEFQRILHMNVNDILGLFKNISYQVDEENETKKNLLIQVDANEWLEGNGNLNIAVNLENQQIRSLSIENLSYQGYSLNAKVQLNDFEEMPQVQESDYQDYAPVLTIYDEVKRLSKETEFGFDVDMRFQNGDKKYQVKGFVQFALHERVEDNLAYVELNINDGTKDHSLIMDYRGQTMYFAYNNKLFAYMQVSTLKDMIGQIKDLLNDEDPLLDGIHALLPDESELSVIMQILNGDYSKISLELLKEVSIEKEQAHIVLSKEILGSKSDMDITIGYQNESLTSLSIQDLTLGGITMNLQAGFSHYDESKRLSDENHFLDLNTLNILLRLGINTMHQKYYHLKGNAEIKVLAENLIIPLDCYILNDNGNVSLMINFEDIPVIALVNTLPAGMRANNTTLLSYNKSSSGRNAQIYIHDGFAYIYREETVKFTISKAELYQKEIKVTTEEFMNNIFSYLFDNVMGMKDSISSAIKDSMTMPPIEEMKFDEVINDMSYQESEKQFNFDLNMSSITGNDKITSTNIAITHTTTEGEEHLSTASMNMKISVVVSIDVKVNLHIEDYGTSFDENEKIFSFCEAYPYQTGELFVSHHK